MALFLHPLHASDWPDDLVELFKQRGVPENVLRARGGFCATSMSPDGVSYEYSCKDKGAIVLTKDSKIEELFEKRQNVLTVEAKTEPLADRAISQFPQKPKKVLTQNALGSEFKPGLKYGVTCRQGAILEHVELGEKGVIISGKIISGFVEQNGIIYAGETIFSRGIPDRPGVKFEAS